MSSDLTHSTTATQGCVVAPENKRTCVLVLGMHRSGTSAVTRWLNLLGADLPQNLMQAREENNALGFWESRDICQLNDELLELAGSHWDDWRNYSQRSTSQHQLKSWQGQAKQQLLKDFSDSSLFVLKDPRMCRVLPQWQPILEELGCAIKVIIPLRNPLEVAQSLERRDEFNRDKACLLWLRHVLDAEFHSRALPRVWIDYAELLQDWQPPYHAVCEGLQLDLPSLTADTSQAIDTFLNPQHRHQQHDGLHWEGKGALDADIEHCYAALRTLSLDANDTTAKTSLDAIRAKLNEGDSYFGEAFGDEIRQRKALVQAQKESARALQNKLDNRIARVSELENIASERSQLIQDLQHNVLKQQEKQRALEEKLSNRVQRVDELEQLAATRQQQQREVEEKLENRIQRVSELEQLATVRQKQQRDIEEKLENRIQRVVQLESATTEQKQRLKALESKLANRIGRISELQEALAQKNQKLEDRIVRVQQLEQLARDRKDIANSLHASLTSIKNRLERLDRAHHEQKVALENARRSESRQRSSLHTLRKQHKQTKLQQRQLKRRLAISSLLLYRNSLMHEATIDLDALPPRVCYGVRLSLLRRRLIRRQTRALLSSGLFDLAWYLDREPDIRESSAHPVWHWLLIGHKEHRAPNALFDPVWYLQQNPDVASAGENALLHYMHHGRLENRDPSPLFSQTWYLSQNPEFADAEQSPLAHFLQLGQAQGLSPNRYFEPAWYAQQNPELASFDIQPLDHFLALGWREGRNPSALFWTSWYLQQNPDIKAAEQNPLIHYLSFGLDEGRAPCPLIDPQHYWQQLPHGREEAKNALEHYLQSGWQAGLDPSPWFDTDWYWARNLDVREAQTNPLLHFLRFGLAEQRSPGPRFDSDYYLEQNPDVANDGQIALCHYLDYGAHEGRLACPPLPALPELGGLPSVACFTGQQSPNPKHPNVLICAHAAHGHLFGGERSFIDILALLEPLPYNVHVAIPKDNQAYIELLKPLAVQICHIPYAYWRKDLAADNASIDLLKAYMVSQNIRLVHANTIVIREPLIAARELQIPCATHVRESVHDDSWMSKMLGLGEAEIVQQVTASTDCIIANSIYSAREFDKPDATFVVPNTFDMEVLDIANERPADGRLNIGLISSNIPKKGLDDFVQLAASCAHSLPQLKFKLIGPDNEHVAQLRQQLTSAGTDNLEFVGYQNSPEEALSHINVVLSLSHFAESFGRTVAEGLAARRPALVYDLGAAQDLIQADKSGWVIPYPQWQAAIPLLEKLSQEPKTLETMGAAGRADMQARYSREQGVKALHAAYQHMLQDGPTENVARTIPAPRFSTDTSQPSLRLAYFCWHFPVPSETFVLNELRILVAKGIDVLVYCRQTPHPDFVPDFAIQWNRVSSPEELAQQLLQHERTHVHAHFTYPTVTDMVWPACVDAGIPFTFIAHAQDIFKYDNDLHNRVGEIAQSEQCRAVFTLGRFHRDFLVARGVPQHKLIINPNSIDPEHFRFQAPAPRPSQQVGRVCAIHRLTEKKGLHDLVDAAALLQNEPIEINIYGYGDEEPRLRSMIKARGLNNIHMRGPLNGSEEILQVLHQHDLFACPSIRTANGDMDGIPTVLLESMSAGTPVITTQVASIPDLVQDQVTGLMVNPNDPASLAEGIRRFFNLDIEQVQTLAGNARNAVEKQHDAKKLTQRLLHIWRADVIDIVVVSWNNLAELQKVIEHLYRHTKSNFHLSICDNASGPDVVAFLFDLQRKHDNVSVVHRGENTFVGPGTNTAADQGRSAYVIYVCGKEGFALADGWETDMTSYMDTHPEIGLGGSLGYSPSYLTGASMPEGLPLFGEFRNPSFAEQNPQRKFFHVQGGLFIMRRAMYEDIGGFSASVPHAYTDVEYSYYAESCGWQLGNIDSTLALFNKTQPSIWSRIHEGVKVIHPPTLQDLQLLDDISEKRVRFCNICQWSAAKHQLASNEFDCPQCGSQAGHRSLYRYLSESTFSFRRLPALWINPHNCLEPYWTHSFQGRQLDLQELNAEIDRAGHIDTASQALPLIAIHIDDTPAHHKLAHELHRMLAPDGEILLFQSQHTALNTDWQRQLSNAGLQQQHGFQYASDVVRYDTRRTLIFSAAQKQ